MSEKAPEYHWSVFLSILGVNSGVMLMNLTRMREVNWVDEMVAYYKEYHLRITWGDQDLVNIYFHFSPGRNLFWYLISINMLIDIRKDHHYTLQNLSFQKGCTCFHVNGT